MTKEKVPELHNPRSARVLIVDDEPSQRKLLRAYLAKEGYVVHEASDFNEAVDALSQHFPDLAVVDVMLPGDNGFELVREIRRRSTLPIVMLTARGEESAKVMGLELGADDYVVKPYSAPEVISRIRANLRRSRLPPSDPNTLLTVGPLTLAPATRRCFVNTIEVVLSRREFDLAVILASNVGSVLTRDDLLHQGWGTRDVGEKTVDVHIASLRRKLGSAFPVRSLRGIGYRLEPSP
jgi:DNA-binding response OmpR family regulator